MTIIFLAYKLPDPISDELARQGHSVYECLAISEVFTLAEEHFNAQIMVRTKPLVLNDWAIDLWKQLVKLRDLQALGNQKLLFDPVKYISSQADGMNLGPPK
jgi:hypothetical protein